MGFTDFHQKMISARNRFSIAYFGLNPDSAIEFVEPVPYLREVL
jgi:hypothetical protein